MRNKIAFIADLPPPLHGMSLINSELFAEVSKSFLDNVILFNTSRKSLYAKTVYFFFIYFNIAIYGYRSIYISLYGGLGIVYQLPIIIYSKLRNRTLFVHHHSYAYINKFSYFQFLLVDTNITHIFLSKKMESDYKKVYGKHVRSLILDNKVFIPARLSSPEKREESTQRISVGFIGAITELKGITRFLDDLITLKKEGWELKLVVCGSFDDNLPQVIKSDVVNKCVYLGRKFGEEKFTEFFNSIDLLYFPTMYPNEAQPLVVYEALSAGVKVVASNVGTIKQQLELPIFGSVIDDSSVQSNRLQAVRMELANLQIDTKPLVIEAYDDSQNKAIKDLSYILEVIKYELGT